MPRLVDDIAFGIRERFLEIFPKLAGRHNAFAAMNRRVDSIEQVGGEKRAIRAKDPIRLPFPAFELVKLAPGPVPQPAGVVVFIGGKRRVGIGLERLLVRRLPMVCLLVDFIHQRV